MVMQGVKVRRTQVLMRDAVADDVIRGDEQAMADRHGCPFGAAAARELAKLGVEVRGFGAPGGPGAFDQKGAQPAVSFAGFAALTFPRTLFLTWTE